MSAPRLVLASGSPRRRELMALLSVPVTVEGADIDESLRPGEPPAAYAQRLSREKALAVAPRHPSAMVIAADTIVVLHGEILGKPRDEADAARMLRALSGKRHLVMTAVTVIDSTTGKALTDLCESRVTLRVLSEEEIAAYVASGEPMDKAGGYAIQDERYNLAEQVVGCPANVMGLPMCHVLRSLHRHGAELPESRPTACRIQFGGLLLRHRRHRDAGAHGAGNHSVKRGAWSVTAPLERWSVGTLERTDNGHDRDTSGRPAVAARAMRDGARPNERTPAIAPGSFVLGAFQTSTQRA